MLKIHRERKIPYTKRDGDKRIKFFFKAELQGPCSCWNIQLQQSGKVSCE